MDVVPLTETALRPLSNGGIHRRKKMLGVFVTFVCMPCVVMELEPMKPVLEGLTEVRTKVQVVVYESHTIIFPDYFCLKTCRCSGVG